MYQAIYLGELCTKEYSALTELMRDAERVEAAFRRSGRTTIRNVSGDRPRPSRPIELVPMELGSLKLKKLSSAERDMCRKQGRCFRCRGKGHMANKYPKARGN